MNRQTFGVVTASVFVLAACSVGSGDDSSVPPPAPAPPASTPTFTVGGTVSGLTAPELTVFLNADFDGDGNQNQEFLAITANGPFTFPSALADGTTYSVVVFDTDDKSQVCGFSVPGESRSAGTINSANVTDLEIVCVPGYLVSGTVNDLKGSGLTLGFREPRFGVTQALVTSGSFEFGPLLSGESFEVTVDVQPSSPTQQCVVINGSGVIADTHVTNVEVNCGDATVGGEVTGLQGAGLIIALSREVEVNGVTSMLVVERKEISADGPFEFDTLLNNGEPYEVTVWQQPTAPDQECLVRNATGTISGNVTNVEVRCPGPRRVWRFDNTTTRTPDAQGGLPDPLQGGDCQLPGKPCPGPGGAVLDDSYSFGPGPSVPLGLVSGLGATELFLNFLDEPDSIGVVHSNATGFTYWLAVESPFELGRPTRDSQLHYARLDTTWRWRKVAPDTRFKLEITHVQLLAYDDVHAIGATGRLWTGAALQVRAHRVSGNNPTSIPFFNRHDAMYLEGTIDPVDPNGALTRFELVHVTPTDADDGLWTIIDNFDLDRAAGAPPFASPTQVGFAQLVQPFTVEVDLSDLSVGEEFLVVSHGQVLARNTYSTEGGAATYLRDPGAFDPGLPDGGVTVAETEGVVMVDLGDVDLDQLAAGGGPPPDVCDPANTNRSILELTATDYRVGEIPGFPPYVTVTRSGSAAGILTAVVSLMGGSAVASEDFTARDFVVRFGDSSTGPRMIELPIIDDDRPEGDETLTVTLHSPEGCATIGARSSATVTITDND